MIVKEDKANTKKVQEAKAQEQNIQEAMNFPCSYWKPYTTLCIENFY